MKKISVLFTSRLCCLICTILISLISNDFVFAQKNNKIVNQKDTSLNEKSAFPSLFTQKLNIESNQSPVALHPLAVSFVENYLLAHVRYLKNMQTWAQPYFNLYNNILSQYGLPTSLKYLSVIESSLQAGAVSHAGAVGPWQFMPPAAKLMGLVVSSSTDERTNYTKSTHAAANFLKQLHQEFNDWLLVIAAYNCGAGRVRQAIRNGGSCDFWQIQQYLPMETQNHVKKFIATHYLFEGNGGVATMTANELNLYNKAMEPGAAQKNSISWEGNLDSIPISGKYKSAVIAEYLQMDKSQLQKLNPGMDAMLAKGFTYTLRLPAGMYAKFIEVKQKILNACIANLLN